MFPAVFSDVFANILLLVMVIIIISCSLIDGEEINYTNETSGITIRKTDQENSKLGPVEPTLNHNLEAFMSTVEIIMNRGYHAEMHPVTTDDGYKLMVHRIPYPKGRKSGPTGRPILIQNGLAGSSSDFILLPSEKALAFILADLGYDVWLGNTRGNIYSRAHVKYDSSRDKAYWKFSFDEMGRYDIPATINHILTVTGREKLLYIGLSMGTTVLFTSMHHHPELSDKIELSVLMAPVSTIAYTKSVFRYFIPLRRVAQFLLWLFHVDLHFISPTDGIYSGFVKRFCLRHSLLAFLCHNSVSFLIAGADYGHMDPAMIDVVLRHLPTGASIRTAAHFAQNGVRKWDQSPQFNQYSYGWAGNLKRYGKIHPPAYDLSKVTVPVYIFHGANDLLSTPEDVRWLASKLPNVKQVNLVKNPGFNHVDFQFHRDAKELVYDHITALLPPP